MSCLEIVRNRKVNFLKLKQEAYTEKFLSRFDITHSKDVTKAMKAQHDKATTDEELIDENIVDGKMKKREEKVKGEK